MRLFKLFSILILCHITFNSAFAAKFYIAVKCAEEMKIDGKLDEKEWLAADWTDSFSIIKTGANPLAQTYFAICYDENYLYIGIRAEEKNMKYVRDSIKKHDGAIWDDDCVEILIAPTQKTQDMGFHFLINPSGFLHDEKRKDDKGDSSWDSACNIGVRKNDSSWEVELAISLKNLGGLDKKDIPWGINICRERYACDPPELSSWSFTPKGFVFSAYFGKLIFGAANYMPSLRNIYLEPIGQKIMLVEKELTKMPPSISAKYRDELKINRDMLIKISVSLDEGKIKGKELEEISNISEKMLRELNKIYNYVRIESLIAEK